MGHILTIEQAAEMLQLNPQVVRYYLRSGKLPGVKVGRHWRIAEDDLLDFIRRKHASLESNQSKAEEKTESMVAETAARYKPEREWKNLSQEERVERIKSVRGRFKALGLSSEEFMRVKHKETEEEESRWEERHKK